MTADDQPQTGAVTLRVSEVKGTASIARIFKYDERNADADLNNRHWSQASHSREWDKTVSEFLKDRNER